MYKIMAVGLDQGPSKRRLLSRALFRRLSSVRNEDVASHDAFIHGVSRTALLSAHYRQLETAKGKGALVYDPYARALAGAEGEEVAKTFSSAVKDTRFFDAATQKQLFYTVVIIRTKYWDDFIRNALSELHKQSGGGDRPLQFVNVGSGLDTRPWRFPWPSKTCVFEVDRAEVQEFKKARIEPVAGKALCYRHVSVLADVVGDDWESGLVEQGFDPTLPTVWLSEGVLAYLPGPEVKQLLKRIRTMSADGSQIAADTVSTGTLKSQTTGGVRQYLSKIDAPIISATDDGRELMKGTGWHDPYVVEMGTDKAHFGRWKIPQYYHWAPAYLAPKMWLMTAYAKGNAARVKGGGSGSQTQQRQ